MRLTRAGWWWVFMAGQVFDAASTLALVQRGGVEINPAMAALLGAGPIAFALVKLSAAGLLAALAARWAPRALALGLAATALVCVYHAGLLAVY